MEIKECQIKYYLAKKFPKMDDKIIYCAIDKTKSGEEIIIKEIYL